MLLAEQLTITLSGFTSLVGSREGKGEKEEAGRGTVDRGYDWIEVEGRYTHQTYKNIMLRRSMSIFGISR